MSHSPQQHQSILVRGVNWLGDAVMATPALQRLREAQPKAKITLLTHVKLQGLWRRHPAIDEVILFAEGENVFSVGRKLREGKFDAALVLPNSPRSALETRLAGIPRRVGVARPWRNWLLTEALPPHPGIVPMRKRPADEIKRLIQNGAPPAAEPRGVHHIHQYLHLAAAFGAKTEPMAPQLFVSDGQIQKFMVTFNLTPESRWFGLNPGAEYGPAKRWPEERFIAAAVELHRRTNCRWFLFGVTADWEANARILQGIHHRAARQGIRFSQPLALNLAGETGLLELCAGLKFCRVLLTNDSGPMHVAAALGTPVVVPFGSTSPEQTGPGLPGDTRHQILRANAPCSPCFLRECPVDFRCMNGISVESVVEAVEKVAGQ